MGKAKTHPGVSRGHWTPSLDSGAGKILEEHLDQEVLLWASLGEKKNKHLPCPGLLSGHNSPHTSHMQNIHTLEFPRLSRSRVPLRLQAQAQSQGPWPSHLPDTQPEHSGRAGFLKACTKVGKPEAPGPRQRGNLASCLFLCQCSICLLVPCSGLLLLLFK